ncbi:MAG: MerR family transcriptional regulator [Nocardioides sp.]|nr:MerR family transcriptional regulator [Nocardioides sp.]
MTAAPSFPDAATPGLTIGGVADRTGVGAPTLRMWESRHGFPEPHRLASGHRRYDESTVDTVLDVQSRRAKGVRLDVAINEALAEAMQKATPAAPSVYAELRLKHPSLAVNRLRKSTLLGLSWAIEDEFAATSQRAYLFGAFQRAQHFEAARPRWSELSRTASGTFAFADFKENVDGRMSLVSLNDEHPLQREWAVVCDSSDLPVALTAWELPGQQSVRDRDRIFESVWTVDPPAVRDAARVCAAVAARQGSTGAGAAVAELARDARSTPADMRAVTGLFNRIVAYVDHAGR